MGVYAVYKSKRPINYDRRLQCKRLYWVCISLALPLPLDFLWFISRYRGAIGYNFDSSYTSHAHGWSTGPTSALTFYVVGLQLTAPQGSKWTLKPHLADLSAAEGGFTTSLGWFGASWNISSTSSGEGGSTETILIKLETPVGTSGYAVLPGDGTQMVVDGNPTFVPSSRSIELDGGSHEIVVSQ